MQARGRKDKHENPRHRQAAAALAAGALLAATVGCTGPSAKLEDSDSDSLHREVAYGRTCSGVGHVPGTRPVGSSWRGGQEKQVAFIGNDSHVHELSLQGNHWVHGDLTQLAGGLAAIGSWLDAFGLEADQSKQVVYTGTDGWLHMLSSRGGGSWHDENLNTLAGAPVPNGGPYHGFAWEAGSSKVVIYVSSHDRHVRELSQQVGGAWQHTDLTAMTGAPDPGSTVAAYAWNANHAKQVVFVSPDAHVQLLEGHPGGAWQRLDLTQISGAPLAGGAYIQGFEAEMDGSSHVVYMSVGDGHFHELSRQPSGAWHDVDLTLQTGAPLSQWGGFEAFHWKDHQSNQIVYLTEDEHFHELVQEGPGGAWWQMDLSELSCSPLAQGRFWGAYAAGGEQRVVYTTADGDVHELRAPFDYSWQHANLSEMASAPPVK